MHTRTTSTDIGRPRSEGAETAGGYFAGCGGRAFEFPAMSAWIVKPQLIGNRPGQAMSPVEIDLNSLKCVLEPTARRRSGASRTLRRTWSDMQMTRSGA